MTSVFSCNDNTKNIYNIVHRQKRNYFEAVSYCVPILRHFCTLSLRNVYYNESDASVRVKEFSFHLFVKVYRYPMSNRNFHWISVDHKRFGILVYFNGRQLITSIYTRKASNIITIGATGKKL